MKRLLMITAALVALTVQASAQNQTTFRDSRGSTVGTATTNGNQTTFRDSRGSTTGTATRNNGGTTTYRDNRGSTVGTSTGPQR